ncbi:M48 family metallopeptidase [Cognatishimia sp. MH4019]|uniref:M48 family metallopeptidase n=1 Tax=Cognatishimia sp. MH4019 TaxID=2854030 RepID=UPI001CD70646|nr:M48 family metallopeptidase [Cognatishimia sp. MH4019]
MTLRDEVWSTPAPPVFGDLMDGERALPLRVAVTLTATELVIAPGDGEALHWPLGKLRRLLDQAHPTDLVLAQAGDPVTRLVLRDKGFARQIEGAAPALAKRPPVQNAGKLLGWSVAAVASVALIIFVLVPVMANQLATFLPPSGEKALGDTTFEQIRTALDNTGLDPVPMCESPDGLAALAKMEARLTETVDLPYPLTVRVLDHEMINAFALPGGYVVLFDGLLDMAEDPDEIAAVFAHEVGHVVARDPSRMALRSAGSIGVLGLLFGDFAGGAVVLFLAERLIQASYSQEAEMNADIFASETLEAAGVSPLGLARMFERFEQLNGDQPSLLDHFMAHPDLVSRIERAEASGSEAEYTPSLTDAEWQALKTICD